MSEKSKARSILEIMNDVLSTVRDYYDAEYAYYIERDEEEVLTIYEWCAENIPWQRDRIKMLEPEQMPAWMKYEITDTRAESYSVFESSDEGVTTILAVVNVRRGGCEIALMRAVLPYLSQAVILQKTQKQQEYLSYHDDLTGLLNRNSFVGYLSDIGQKKLQSAGVLSADINGLKNFNREFGREYGDEVVIRVGEILEEFFRGGDVYRMTGDEYMVIAENIPYEKFMKSVHAAYEKLENISLGLVSFGYAWEKIDIDVNGLISRAEHMMQEEKKKYYKHLRKGHHEPIIKQDLQDDIKDGNFIVCLVPIMDLHSDEVVGAEAVVRYHHKDLGIVHPARYMTLLEETRLSQHLDLYVFEEVCRTLRRWEEEDMQMLPISVNFAESTLRQEDITERMLSIVERQHVSCEYLQVEIAETAGNMNQEMLAETGNKIRKENIRVVLDRFGAKSSSFAILSIMEFDGLKLDQSLVDNIVGNGRNQILAQAVVDVCRRLGVSVSAVGVETQDQLNVLKELGCDSAQGTLFNKPITIDTFEKRYMGH